MPPVRLNLGSSDEEEEDDEKEPEDDDDQDDYDESEQEEEEGTNSQQLARQMRAKQERKRKQQQEEEEEEQRATKKRTASRGRNGGVAANGKGKAKAIPDKIKRVPGRPRKKVPAATKTAALFHRACLKHLVPKDHCEVPERLSATIEVRPRERTHNPATAHQR
jgi:hypothetical protein